MRKGSKHSPEAREKIRQHNLRTGKVPPSRKGISPTPETRKKQSDALKARGFVPHSALGLKRSDEFKQKVSENHARYWKGKGGDQHPGWKGGKTTEAGRIRQSPEYAAWRKAVFERDNYTCQNCGAHGGYLNADHIKPFSVYVDLRLDLDNGRTLCKPCHYRIGWHGTDVAVTPEQLARKRAAQREGARLANHRQWHVARGIINPDCALCAEVE